MPARRAIKFVTGVDLESIEYALNDALAQLALQDALDIKLDMRIALAIQTPFIVGIDYTTNAPWPPAPIATEGQTDAQS